MADVFTTASEIETQGLVLLEALATGLPIVAAKATCIPELVKENVTGYLVPPKDVDALASRLVRLIENPAQAKRMGRNGREFVEKHALEYSLDQHENLYKKHIALRQGARKQHAIHVRQKRLWRLIQ
jgi:glycosyltransferase involved in cell wall biosynthesis